MSEKLHCIICERDFDKTQIITENLQSISYIKGDKLICGKCTGEGWKYCLECNDVFNINSVNFNKFYINYDSTNVPEKFFELIESYIHNEIKPNVNKNDFCCSKDYNLYFWKEKIKSQLSILRMDEVMVLNKSMIPLQGNETIKRLTEVELDELEQYIDSKIEHIKNKSIEERAIAIRTIKQEHTEKAYNEVLKELQCKLNAKELELDRIVIDKIKWDIEETYCKAIITEGYINEYKGKVSELEKNIPMLKKEIEDFNKRIIFFNLHKDTILKINN